MDLRRGISITVVGLALFALMTFGWAGRIRGQTRQEEPLPQPSTAPRERWIDPADHFLLQGFEANVDAKWESVLVEVPAGKWLILTDVSVGHAPAAQLLSVEGKARRILLDTAPYHDGTGPWTAVQGGFAEYRSSVGLVLPPESRLVIRHGGGGKAVDIAWHLTGYYEDV